MVGKALRRLSASTTINTYMRLYELLNEYDFPELKQKTQWSIPDMYKKDLPGKERIGSGGFATAYADKDNPHEVTKGSSRMFMLDGYTSFLEALSKDENAQSNPYFPHFSDINMYKNRLWRTKSYNVKMERLHKTNTLSNAEKAMLREHMFTEYYNTSAVGERLDFHTLMAHAIYKNKTEWMKDENLVAATKFLHGASKEYDFDLDLNAGNFMVRRGPFIPQIVIIDPLGCKTGQGWTI